jgi:hypothetical protein
VLVDHRCQIIKSQQIRNSGIENLMLCAIRFSS